MTKRAVGPWLAGVALVLAWWTPALQPRELQKVTIFLTRPALKPTLAAAGLDYRE